MTQERDQEVFMGDYSWCDIHCVPNGGHFVKDEEWDGVKCSWERDDSKARLADCPEENRFEDSEGREVCDIMCIANSGSIECEGSECKCVWANAEGFEQPLHAPY